MAMHYKIEVRKLVANPVDGDAEVQVSQGIQEGCIVAWV
jgi:hypothetical protein